MARTGSRHGGQASLETVALTVLVALLMAGLAAWAARALPGSFSPPPVFERAARPLAPAPAPPAAASPEAPSSPGAPLWRRALRLYLDADMAFARGFTGRLGARARPILEDPLSLVPRPEDLIPDPLQSVRDLRTDIARFRDYVAHVRRMPRREALLTVSEDVGALSADVAIDVGTRGVLRGARRLGAGPPAGARGAGRAGARASVSP